jgi:hypothetical protein
MKKSPIDPLTTHEIRVLRRCVRIRLEQLDEDSKPSVDRGNGVPRPLLNEMVDLQELFKKLTGGYP